jgi:hypothetical protein
MTPIKFTECFNYTSAGLITKKKLVVSKTVPGGYGTANQPLEANYTYDSLGRMTSMQYPSYHVNSGGAYNPGDRPHPHLRLRRHVAAV